jgi:hypothetical protein
MRATGTRKDKKKIISKHKLKFNKIEYKIKMASIHFAFTPMQASIGGPNRYLR